MGCFYKKLREYSILISICGFFRGLFQRRFAKKTYLNSKKNLGKNPNRFFQFKICNDFQCLVVLMASTL